MSTIAPTLPVAILPTIFPTIVGGGSAVFDPNSVGLDQLLFTTQLATLAGVIADERTGLGSSRPFQDKRVYEFDETNDYINSPTSVLQSDQPYSFSFWINISGTSNQLIVSDQEDGSNYTGVHLASGTSMCVYKYIAGVITRTLAPISTSSGNWAHFVITSDGTDWVMYENAAVMTQTSLTTPRSSFVGFNISSIGNPLGAKLFDVRAYDRELTESEVAAIYTDGENNLYPANLVAHYKCDEGAGTTAYDSSGNGNDGTINNATLSTFHATDSNAPYSWQNEVGYSDGAGGVYVPRDESDTANDVLGDPLDYTGKAANPGQATGSACGTFDGVDDEVSFSSINSQLSKASDHSGSIRIRANDTSTNQVILGSAVASNDRFYIGINSDVIRLSSYNGSTFTAASEAFTDTSAFHTIAWSYDSTAHTLTATLDGVAMTGALGAATASTVGTKLGRSVANTLPFNGRVCDFQITGGSRYPLSEYSGATAHDVSGNGNHGTINNATTTTGAGFWANTQDIFHWSLAKGFTASSGVEVPALADGSADADGNTISNPARVGHNGGITDLTLADGSWSYNDARSNPAFKRTLTSSAVAVAADRFVTASATLSGDDLTNMNTYVTTTEI